jgi:type I restriction enzyme M protein
MDIHKIVDVFNKRLEIAKYSRMVPFEEIERNEYNLNIPCYIDSQQAEDVQDIDGHLRGGIPTADVDALQRYWDVCPQLRRALFKNTRPGHLNLTVDKQAIKSAIYEHSEFVAFIASMNALFTDWRKKSAAKLRGLQARFHPKQVIADLSEDLLAHYSGKPLIDKYDVYQHLVDYWAETMQDDPLWIDVTELRKNGTAGLGEMVTRLSAQPALAAKVGVYVGRLSQLLGVTDVRGWEYF